jgi:hypothetical protein
MLERMFRKSAVHYAAHQKYTSRWCIKGTTTTINLCIFLLGFESDDLKLSTVHCARLNAKISAAEKALRAVCSLHGMAHR